MTLKKNLNIIINFFEICVN